MPRNPAWRLVAAVTLLAFVPAILPRVAFADAGQDKALAAQLFKDARAMMDNGNYADACPKLETAAKLEPAADGIVLNLGLCYEGHGRWATAWAYLNESVARAHNAGNAEREKLAKEHLAAIEPRISRVTIHVAPEVRIAGLALQWDERVLDPGAWGTAFPVDPGAHHLVASAPGKKTWETDVGIGATSDSKTIDVLKLEDAPAVATTATEAKTPASDLSGAAPAAVEQRTPTLAYVLTGAGVVLLGGAVASQFLASSAANERHDACLQQVATTCDDTGKSKVRTWEAVSFVAGGLAVASLGVGIYLWTSSPKTESARPAAFVRVVPSFGGVAVQGGF